MKYILDTCVLSELVKNRPEKKVQKWIEECDEELLYLSVLTIGEIQKGIVRLKDKTKRNTIQRWLDSDLRERFAERILPIDEDTILTWGIMQGESEVKGLPIPTIDGLIGATALTHNLTVVTRDEKDIARTGARVLNPWKL